jgi:hypothetical protein
MHGPIQDRLEDLLKGRTSEAGLDSHLASCSECRDELALMRNHAQMLHALRAPEEMEPAPGFYARVLQRIEERDVYSIWSVFTDSPFGKWLAYGSLALALGVGTWIVGAEREDGHIGSEPVIAQQPASELPPITGDKAHQRDVVLVNLASYSEQSQ